MRLNVLKRPMGTAHSFLWKFPNKAKTEIMKQISAYLNPQRYKYKKTDITDEGKNTCPPHFVLLPPGKKYLIGNGKLVQGKCARGLEQFDMIRRLEKDSLFRKN